MGGSMTGSPMKRAISGMPGSITTSTAMTEGPMPTAPNPSIPMRPCPMWFPTLMRVIPPATAAGAGACHWTANQAAKVEEGVMWGGSYSVAGDCDPEVDDLGMQTSNARPGAFLVGLDQPRITDDIRDENRHEPSLGALFGHGMRLLS